VPRKVGLAPVQRDGVDYEFDVVGDLDPENTLLITKTRCPALSGGVIPKPGAEFAETLLAWLSDGAPVAQPAPAPAAQPARPAAAPARPLSLSDAQALVEKARAWLADRPAGPAAELTADLLAAQGASDLARAEARAGELWGNVPPSLANLAAAVRALMVAGEWGRDEPTTDPPSAEGSSRSSTASSATSASSSASPAPTRTSPPSSPGSATPASSSRPGAQPAPASDDASAPGGPVYIDNARTEPPRGRTPEPQGEIQRNTAKAIDHAAALAVKRKKALEEHRQAMRQLLDLGIDGSDPDDAEHLEHALALLMDADLKTLPAAEARIKELGLSENGWAAACTLIAARRAFLETLAHGGAR
jgi:hypothetical protein